ncbi:hypothetical protein LCGC14_2180920 [marine sediment metagenome]|uniref:Uncharacterized protein n=2 Tax=marine sediment metagenome TaxID=412755 RepID=A0A0F9E9H9_9ZZZZ
MSSNLNEQPKKPKPWYASKTIWANIMAFAGTMGLIFGVDLGLTPEVQAQIVAATMAVVNVVLRLITTQAVK